MSKLGPPRDQFEEERHHESSYMEGHGWDTVSMGMAHFGIAWVEVRLVATLGNKSDAPWTITDRYVINHLKALQSESETGLTRR